MYYIKLSLISMTCSVQRSGYPMEYHGNHYFVNIKNECFLHLEGLISLILLNFAHAT